MTKEIQFFKTITKSLTTKDSDRRLFEGLLTVEMVDKQNEVTVVDELMKALPLWMGRGAPISDTHSNRIIGKGINFQKTEVEANGTIYPAILIQGEIFKDYELDDEIWDKIKSGEYKGLSFGGATRSDREPIKNKDGTISYALSDLEHYEVAVCFMKGTKILMGDEKQKNIEDVKVGDKVIGHDGKPHRVTQVMKRPYNGWMHKVNSSLRSKKDKRYKNNQKPLFVTPNHPIMMEDGTFRKVKDLKKGDRVKTAHIVWNKGKFGFRGNRKSRYKQVKNSYQKNKELERIEKERKEFEKQGWKYITIAHHAIPDAIAVKDGKVLAIEVEYGTPNYEKYLTFKHDYDDIIWLQRSKYKNPKGVKLSSTSLRCTGKKSGFYHKGYVYNLEVEDVHTYVANGIICHNCEDPAVPLALILEHNQLAKSNIKKEQYVKRDENNVCIRCTKVGCYIDKWNTTNYTEDDKDQVRDPAEGKQEFSDTIGGNKPYVDHKGERPPTKENPPVFKEADKIRSPKADPSGKDSDMALGNIGAGTPEGGGESPSFVTLSDDEDEKDKTVNPGENLVTEKPIRGIRGTGGERSFDPVAGKSNTLYTEIKSVLDSYAPSEYKTLRIENLLYKYGPSYCMMGIHEGHQSDIDGHVKKPNESSKTDQATVDEAVDDKDLGLNPTEKTKMWWSSDNDSWNQMPEDLKNQIIKFYETVGKTEGTIGTTVEGVNAEDGIAHKVRTDDDDAAEGFNFSEKEKAYITKPIRGHSWDYWKKQLMEEQGYDEDTADATIGSWESEDSSKSEGGGIGFAVGVKGSFDTAQQDTGDSRQITARDNKEETALNGRTNSVVSHGHEDDGYSLGKSFELLKLKSRLLKI